MRIPENSMILGRDNYYSLNSYETNVNNNVMVVGSPGCGKTRSIVAPNILAAEGSYVISDPKGNLYDQYAPFLRSRGYDVKRLDFVNPSRSIHYNPLSYIHTEQDITKIAYLLANTSEDGKKRHQDPFWTHTSALLYSSLIAYAKEVYSPSDQTLETVFKLINAAAGSADDVDKGEKLRIDDLFHALAVEEKLHGRKSFALKQFKKFRVASGRTLNSILISSLAGIANFDTFEINQLMSYDETDILSIGKEKTAFFVVTSDTDRSMDILVNIFFSQVINELCYFADTECEDNRLAVQVRLILDDFATSVRIENFPRVIGSCRSRGISATLCLQSEKQIIASFGEDGHTIIGCCDSYVYLGGNDIETAKSVSERCDEPLMDVLNMPVGSCIILRRGEKPIHSQVFPLEEMDEYKDAIKAREKTEEYKIIQCR